jgi:hypothetical protein
MHIIGYSSLVETLQRLMGENHYPFALSVNPSSPTRCKRKVCTVYLPHVPSPTIAGPQCSPVDERSSSSIDPIPVQCRLQLRRGSTQKVSRAVTVSILPKSDSCLSVQRRLQHQRSSIQRISRTPVPVSSSHVHLGPRTSSIPPTNLLPLRPATCPDPNPSFYLPCAHITSTVQNEKPP